MYEFINWNPDRHELRKFARNSLLSSIVFGALLWWAGSRSSGLDLDLGWNNSVRQGIALFLWIHGPLVFLLSRILPAAARGFYRVWMGFGATVAGVLTWVLLGVVFYGMITPIALVFRLLGRDPLDRAWEDDRPSYWIKRDGERDRNSYYRQF